MSSKYTKDKEAYVDWLDSSNLIFRKKVFEQIGGFDENIKYTEDVDLGFKATRNNCKLIFDPSLKSVHLGYENTIGGFIRRQLAGGRSIFTLIRNNGFLLNWRISCFIGFYSVWLVLLLIGLLLNPWLSIISLFVMAMLAFLISLERSLNTNYYKFLPQLTLLVFLSGISRSFALILPERK